jgi:hypothetical protein
MDIDALLRLGMRIWSGIPIVLLRFPPESQTPIPLQVNGRHVMPATDVLLILRAPSAIIVLVIIEVKVTHPVRL